LVFKYFLKNITEKIKSKTKAEIEKRNKINRKLVKEFAFAKEYKLLKSNIKFL